MRRQHASQVDHPLQAHQSFRAVIAATPLVADVARESRQSALVGRLALAAGDLATGFAAPVGSTSQRDAHYRAWVTVRELDRSLTAIRISKRVSVKLIKQAQRAIDRADIFIGALPGVSVA